MRKDIFILSLLISFIILYYPVIFTYFSQDDFFHFKVSQTNGSISQFINFFGFHPFTERGIAFYRPIFREALYNIFFNFFGLNPLPFRVLSLSIHLLNTWLVYLLIQTLFLKKKVSALTAFFFCLNPSNVAALYYLAGGIQVLGATMFILLTITSYLKYLQGKKNIYLLFSFLVFLFGLASHELTSILPLLLFTLIITRIPAKKILIEILKLGPFLSILLIYLYLEITRIGFSSGEQQYQAIFNIKTTLNSMSWYLGWSIGLPEMLNDFVMPGLKLNPALMRYWGNYYSIIFTTFSFSVGLMFFFLVYLFIKRRTTILDKNFLFLLTWIPIGILPVLFLPEHKSTQYLTPTLPAVWGAISFIAFNSFLSLKKKFPKLATSLVFFLFINLFVLTVASVKIESINFWAASRGRLAEKLIKDIKNTYPALPKGAILYFRNDPNYPHLTKEWGGTSKQASLVLNGSDALQLLYRDPTLKVFYEDLGGIPKELINKKIYSITAKIL